MRHVFIFGRLLSLVISDGIFGRDRPDHVMILLPAANRACGRYFRSVFRSLRTDAPVAAGPRSGDGHTELAGQCFMNFSLALASVSATSSSMPW
jgi:hypothetical protein